MLRNRTRLLLVSLLGLLLVTAGGDWAGRSEAQNVVQTIRSASVDARDAVKSDANFVRIRDTTEEFIVDFGLNDEAPASPSRPIKIEARVVMSPYTAKRMLTALELAVGNHERTFGKIETDPLKRVKTSP